jgi:hypothetical protein
MLAKRKKQDKLDRYITSYLEKLLKIILPQFTMEKASIAQIL